MLSVAFLEVRVTEAERGVIQADYSVGRCGPPCSRRALCLFIRPVPSSSRVYLNWSADNDSSLSELTYFSMIYGQHIVDLMGFPGDSVVKNLPANAKNGFDSLGLQDQLEKEMTAYSSVLPGKSHGQRTVVGCSSWGCEELDTA